MDEESKPGGKEYSEKLRWYKGCSERFFFKSFVILKTKILQ